ncbi:hypothetical protein [Fredinandcohnia quinoae]|uniref:Lipoprotein n=1 Tax=Fredinandcohnia quinoae TaxID=2918902 RepID=A0AAW5EDL8_9BACI|nr:hypothetical protein [Fredinandcohnia sp. SECRCQ15]MCH1626859.1 hypothetical protein [Fredinandcohnia sp. SECRCQ15]
MNKLLLIVGLILIILVSCDGPNNISLDQLTRVDYQQEDGDVIMIYDVDTIDLLITVFEKIEWELNVKVKMARSEDVKATLFFQYDKNMPERLVEYLIWFNRDGSAMIINHEENSMGKLDKANAQLLKEVFLQSN